MIQLNQPILLSAVLVPLVAAFFLPVVGRKVAPKTLATISTLLLAYPLVIVTISLFAPGLGVGSR